MKKFTLLVGLLSVLARGQVFEDETPEEEAIDMLEDTVRSAGEVLSEEVEMNANEESESQQVVPGWEALPEVVRDYCSGAMCNEGDGDCNKNADCSGGNVCKMAACGKTYNKQGRNMGVWADCCGPVGPFDWDYCKLASCGSGEGDCDAHNECGPGLKCGVNNCRQMNPGVGGVSQKADCCKQCSSVRVQWEHGGVSKVQAEYFNSGKVVGTARTLMRPMHGFQDAAVWNMPAMGDGDSIKLSCCKKSGSVCEFFVAVYQCSPCSQDLNGGLPGVLLASGWDSGACAPRFELPSFPDKSHSMVAFHMQMTAGEEFVIPITKDAPHVAVYERSEAIVGRWCPICCVPPPLPSPPCVCIPTV